MNGEIRILFVANSMIKPNVFCESLAHLAVKSFFYRKVCLWLVCGYENQARLGFKSQFLIPDSHYSSKLAELFFYSQT
jgi:hypothetical protein